MLTMFPLVASKWGIDSRHIKKVPVRLMAIRRFHSASVNSWEWPNDSTPATLTTTSSEPRASTAPDTMALTPSSVETSPGWATIEPDNATASAATPSRAAALTSTATTAAPSPARRSAVDRPIPEAAPVHVAGPGRHPARLRPAGTGSERTGTRALRDGHQRGGRPRPAGRRRVGHHPGGRRQLRWDGGPGAGRHRPGPGGATRPPVHVPRRGRRLLLPTARARGTRPRRPGSRPADTARRPLRRVLARDPPRRPGPRRAHGPRRRRRRPDGGGRATSPARGATGPRRMGATVRHRLPHVRGLRAVRPDRPDGQLGGHRHEDPGGRAPRLRRRPCLLRPGPDRPARHPLLPHRDGPVSGADGPHPPGGVPVSGRCDPQFAAVREAFRDNFADQVDDRESL